MAVVVHHLSSREEQQDIRQEAKHSQGNEGAPQALGTAPGAHAGVAQESTEIKDSSPPASRVSAVSLAAPSRSCTQFRKKFGDQGSELFELFPWRRFTPQLQQSVTGDGHLYP